MFRTALLTTVLLSLLIAPAAITPAHAAPAGGMGPSPFPPFLSRNLIVSSIQVIEGSGDVVQDPIAIVKIRNTGFLSTGPFWTRVYTYAGGKAQYHWIYTSSLGAFQSKTITLQLPMVLYGASNYYFVHASVDHTHAVTETNESDNVKWLSITI